MKQRNIRFEVVSIHNPNVKNVIFGQAHFIKSVEDIHEALASSVPGIKFGLAFAEASGTCLIRTSGTDKKMISLAVKNTKLVGCGHTFFIFLENAFPINVLNAVKMVPEVVRIFAATANPLEVIIARTKQGGAVLGVVDGNSPKGVETDKDIDYRKKLLRDYGYKL